MKKNTVGLPIKIKNDILGVEVDVILELEEKDIIMKFAERLELDYEIVKILYKEEDFEVSLLLNSREG